MVGLHYGGEEASCLPNTRHVSIVSPLGSCCFCWVLLLFGEVVLLCFVLGFIFETGSHYTAQANLELTIQPYIDFKAVILLTWSSAPQDCKHVPPFPVHL